MARIEDGIFTQAYTTVGTDLDVTYKLWDATHTLTASEAAAVGEKLIKKSGETEFTMQETSTLSEADLNAGVEVISHPGKVGVGMRIYTNGVGGTGGTNVIFRLLDGSQVTLRVYAGTWLPLATVGCNTAGLLIVA